MRSSAGHGLVCRLALALPLLMLGANILSWLRFGTDLPFYDDWSGYDRGNIESLEWRRLFQAANNTMAPVGLALDALAQRWLGGNVIAYQLISMTVVLGALLWLQWRLLGWAVRDDLTRCVAFAFTVPMLQARTYWGEQNLAYHQALPLVFLLVALYFTLVGGRRRLTIAATGFALGLLAGLSYISGAFTTLSAGLALLLMSTWHRVEPSLRLRMRSGGAGVLLAGAFTSALQLYATRLAPDTDGYRRVPLAWPHESDFWMFLAGKIGRSFGPGFGSVGAEMIFAFMLGAVLLAVAIRLALVCWRRSIAEVEPDAQRLAIVYLSLFVIVAVYLSLVSLGRAAYREPSIEGATAVFLLAYQRFHFFWVTALFPWVVAALPWLWRRSAVPPSVKAGPWLAVVAAVGLVLCLSRGIFDVSTYYRDTGQARAADIRCFQRQLGTGEPIQCPGSQILRDWTPAYQHARSLGASFVRYLPIVEHEPPAHWLLDWPRTPARGQLQWHELIPVSGGPDFAAGEDSQVVFTSSDRQAFEQCRVLEVQLRLRPSAASQAQVFVQPRGSAGFSETHSLIKPVAAFAEPVERHFVFDSPRGFEPVLRIDPVDGVGGVELHALRASCRLAAAR